MTPLAPKRSAYNAQELEKIRELKRLGVFPPTGFSLSIGDWISARTCPEGCAELEANLEVPIFVVLDPTRLPADLNFAYLPSIDELLKFGQQRKVSFSQITDYLHRRRFADGREREGILQLFVEHLKTSVRPSS